MPRVPKKKTETTPTARLKRTRRVTTQQKPETAKPETAVSEREISRLAYEIYEARGRTDGAQLDDWLQAERRLLNDAT